jgi:hypothetical protein
MKAVVFATGGIITFQQLFSVKRRDQNFPNKDVILPYVEFLSNLDITKGLPKEFQITSEVCAWFKACCDACGPERATNLAIPANWVGGDGH